MLIYYKCFDDETIGYKLAYRIAAENLSLNPYIIADCVNPVSETRQGWRDVAQQCQANILEIEIICSDPVGHRTRVETREADIAYHKLPTWNDVLDKDYQPWDTPIMTIDTALKSVDESFQDLWDNIKPFLQKSRS